MGTNMKLNIQVTGKEHAGKGHLIAFLTKALRDAGISVTVQGEETHNAPKFAVDNTEKLKGAEVIITELQVS